MTDIIFDYFASRTLSGYYRCGDRLPSVASICRQFQVSALTVRTALSRLRKDGYIETTERKTSAVIYRPAAGDVQLSVYNYLSRKDGIDDIWKTSEFIFHPLALFYLKEQDAASIGKIRSRLKKAKGHPARQIVCLYSEAMQKLNNPLALNLFWEVVRYLHIPYLDQPVNFNRMDDQAGAHIKRMLALMESGNADEGVMEMQAFSRNVMPAFYNMLRNTYNNEILPEQIPFQWQIYRERPQLCYTLAAEIMSKIDCQVYQPNEFLPSCQSLALEYGVSPITMRRTLELLGRMRITETINGIGTRVVSGSSSVYPDYSDPQLAKSLILFLQALQIASLISNSVSVHTLTDLGKTGCAELIERIQALIDSRQVYLLGKVCFHFIGKYSSSAFVREVCHQLYHLLLWGHVLHMIFKKPGSFEIYKSYAIRLQGRLSCGDISGFAGLLAELLFTILKFTKGLLLQLDYQENQLIHL
jgi:DNA-binding transcriptional regulator YhcF (GntR family)